MSDNRTIAKNTAFLYIRMMFTMVVSLYTSRVILQVLGVNDYGIYQAVGGIVGFLSFINGALSSGTSRFLTFELGKGSKEQLIKTFSSTLTIHLCLALLIVLVAETVGLWFLYHKMVIPPNRFDAAVYVYHLSILAACFTITQVPYNACIIAHERMNVFAYVSIIEVSLKLLIVYMLSIGHFDKLKMYATLFLCLNVGLMTFYRLYCAHFFKETKYKFGSYDKTIIKQIASFSGWSLFANASAALNSQGILVLLNMFFEPTVVAARAISIQVNMAANQFVNNFRTATNPQIVKKLAAGDINGSHNLLLSSTKYSYYLMFLLCLPICLLAEPLLKIWLGTVPEYTVIFLQLIIVQSLFQVFDTSFYTALYAMGRLKENALISPTLGFLRFPIIYVLFKMGYSPIALSWASLVTYVILALIIKPYLIVKVANYKWKNIWYVFKPCIIVTVVAIPIPFILVNSMNTSCIGLFLLNVLISVICVMLSVYFLGIDKNMRKKIFKLLANKISKK